jgi:probable HAF family extracellular repeat protein
MVGLGFLHPGDIQSIASAASADGGVVVGSSALNVSVSQAFRWTAAGGMVGLGFVSGQTESDATSVSADGSVVVGTSGNLSFRWTAAGGMVSLGLRPGTTQIIANAVSANGTIIAGGDDGGAFIWDATHGIRSLQPILIADGVNLTGWKLGAATAISADGNTIVGFGTDRAAKWRHGSPPSPSPGRACS